MNKIALWISYTKNSSLNKWNRKHKNNKSAKLSNKLKCNFNNLNEMKT